MRADIGAASALDAVFWNPRRDLDGDSSFLECCRTLRKCTVSGVKESGNGDCIALLRDLRSKDVFNVLLEVGSVAFDGIVLRFNCGILPVSRNVDFRYASDSALYRSVVEVDDVLTLL